MYKLALVGRPNVGKSALFNRIAKRRIAIVDEAEGITRDRLYTTATFLGREFELIDTGGIDAKSKADFNEEIRRQALIAIEEADTLVMVVDGTIGLTIWDEEVAKILLRTQKPLCLAVNKIDYMQTEKLIHDFHSLGIKKIIAVSATQGNNIMELLEAAFEGFDFETSTKQSPEARIAIVGRPNVGKSTLINHLLNDERVVVSPIAGTTRDSVEIPFSFDNQNLILIDTAGVRRKNKTHETVEKFAAVRTEDAITKADVCILVIDAQVGLVVQDKRIADSICEAGKGCILFFNKWDLVKGFRMEHARKSIELESPFLAHCPMIFGSALTGRNSLDTISAALEVFSATKTRINTGQLNKFVEGALQKNHPPMLQGKRLRIYYMTQVAIHPPTFILFVNNSKLMGDTYKKYLTNQFREVFGFAGIPLLMHLKNKAKQKERKSVLSGTEKPCNEDDLDDSYFT
ncbi:MAG: ribosome biogenesis GTPase Der [Chlamydiae bacterium]|nr:ribosome biogenesis GTPase Der [Chlamydiota bacterium]